MILASPLYPAFFGQQQDENLIAGVGQVPGDDKTVAAVIAASGQDHHRVVQIRKFPAQNLIRGAAGVLH